MIWLRALFSIFVIAVIVAFNHSLALAASTEKLKGWKLVQNHNMHKITTVWLTDQAVRVDNNDAGWHITSSAPTWDAIVYSNADKTYCRVPYAQWSKRGFALLSVVEDTIPVPTKTFNQIGEMKLPGGILAVNIAHWSAKSSDVGSMMFRSREQATLSNYTLLTTSALPATKEERLLLSYYYQMAPLNEVAIKFSVSSEKRPMLETASLQSTEFSKDDFALPKGYRKVSDESEVYLNAKDKSKIDDFGQLIGK